MQYQVENIKHRFQVHRFRMTWDARYTILFLSSALLALLVVYPMALLVIKSLPLSNYTEQLAAPQTLLALRNSLYVAIAATAVAVFVGVLLAFLVVRTDMPCKRLVSGGVFLIFLTPGYIGTVAWIQLLGRSGYLVRWLRQHFELLRPPLDIYTLEGVIVIMGLYLMPLVYMASVNALSNADPSLEEAAIVAGASPGRAIFTVALPLALPGIISGALLVFIHCISGFGIPAALAMPAGNMVLTTQIYAALGHYDVPKACVVAVMLAVMLVGVMALHNSLLPYKRHAVTASSNEKRYMLSLGVWKHVLAIVSTLFLLSIALIPLLTILATSLLKAWGLSFELENLTLGNYLSIFSVGLGARALRNSFLFALCGATCATLLGFFIAYITSRTKIVGRKALDFMATMPSVIPGPVLAAAMIFAWMMPPLKLYNTPWIILVAYLTAFLPYAVRNIAGALQSVSPHLEEMGWMCGGSWTTVLRDIVVPGVRGSIWTGWTLAFLMAFREIPLSTMLYSEGTETVGVLLFLLKTESGGMEVVSAVSVVVILLTVAGQMFIRRLASRGDPGKG